jgi:hypothetical protein
MSSSRRENEVRDEGAGLLFYLAGDLGSGISLAHSTGDGGYQVIQGCADAPQVVQRLVL